MLLLKWLRNTVRPPSSRTHRQPALGVSGSEDGRRCGEQRTQSRRPAVQRGEGLDPDAEGGRREGQTLGGQRGQPDVPLHAPARVDQCDTIGNGYSTRDRGRALRTHCSLWVAVVELNGLRQPELLRDSGGRRL